MPLFGSLEDVKFVKMLSKGYLALSTTQKFELWDISELQQKLLMEFSDPELGFTVTDALYVWPHSLAVAYI
jgi:hypothetical protein